MTAPGSTTTNCQMEVPSPMDLLCTSELGWISAMIPCFQVILIIANIILFAEFLGGQDQAYRPCGEIMLMSPYPGWNQQTVKRPVQGYIPGIRPVFQVNFEAAAPGNDELVIPDVRMPASFFPGRDIINIKEAYRPEWQLVHTFDHGNITLPEMDLRDLNDPAVIYAEFFHFARLSLNLSKSRM
jgi:hypothetical protein